MKTRFDLEQDIMSCWNVVEDIDMVAEKYCEDDDVCNVLLAIKHLYQLKFEKLFGTFEECVKERSFTDDFA